MPAKGGRENINGIELNVWLKLRKLVCLISFKPLTLLTAVLFETGAKSVTTKSRNPTIYG